MDALLILGVTFFATLLSSMSGGGSSLICIPAFLSMGISFPMATAMQKVSAIFWVLPAAYNYLKEKKIDWGFLVIFSAIGLVGVYLGVLVVVSIPQRVLELFVGALIILLVLHGYFFKGLGLQERVVTSKIKRFLVYPFALLMGFYESLFGSANGIFFGFVSFYTRGFDFIKALGYNYLIAFPWVTLASVLLIARGYYDLALFVPAIVGSLAGGYLGSRFASFKGNAFIRTAFLTIGFLLGIKLVLGI